MRVACGTLAAAAVLLGPCAWNVALGDERTADCPSVAIGVDEYIIAKSTGEVLLLPVDGDIGVRIRTGGFAERFRFRSGESLGSVRADVQTVAGAVLRGDLCIGCLFHTAESVPIEVSTDRLYLQIGGLRHDVSLRRVLSLEAKGNGEWELAFRSGETARGALTLPTGIEAVSMTTDYGFVDIPLDEIASVTVIGPGGGDE